jgi:hypothetical protein
MLDFPTSARGRQRPASEPPDRAARSFLIESERRVITHCRRLLAAQDLAMEQRQRLIRLIDRAETELQHLVA